MFPRDKRGDGTMIWILVFALLALVVMGFGISFITDFFKGTKSETDALQACEGLVGQLAGGTGFCFADKQCTKSDGSEISVENGEWVYIGDKGCREKDESKPACCVLIGKEGSLSKNAILEKSCSGFEPGTIALVDNVQCTNVANLQTLELEHSYTAIRYYLNTADQKSGTYTARMVLTSKDEQSSFPLLRPGVAKAGTPYVEISLKYSETPPTNGYTFFNFLSGAPESRDLLSRLNDGGRINIFILAPNGMTLTNRTILIPAPKKKICSPQSDVLCVNAFADSSATVIDEATGVTWRPFCQLSSDGSCKYLNEKSNTGNVVCRDIERTIYDSNSECYGKTPQSSIYGNPTCKVRSGKASYDGYLGCSLERISGDEGICRETIISGNAALIPSCITTKSINIVCKDIVGTFSDSSSPCYEKNPREFVDGEFKCKTMSENIWHLCTLANIVGTDGVCRDRNLVDADGRIPECT